MIEFNGKISGRTLKFYANRQKKLLSILSLISCLIVSAFWRAYTMFIPVLLIVFILLLCPPKVFSPFAPHRMYIDLEDRTIVSVTKGNPEVFRMIDDIVEVKDHGEFYTFKFTSPRYYVNFIAQKDLITQGTIEEFEEIFEEVLVRVK